MAAGIIKELSSSDCSYYKAGDVEKLLGVSRSKAYNIMRTMRKECIDAGLLTTAYPTGRIPKKYFNKYCMID